MMTNTQALLTIAVIAIATLLTRAIPFLLFPAGKQTPRYILYLGKVLPCATIGMLVVYCFKDVVPTAAPFGAPELIAVAAVVGLQLWKRNSLLSILGGTILYMALVQFVFTA